MTQFASTLYPQTNPTNPVLLAFRDEQACYSDSVSASLSWLRSWGALVSHDPDFKRSSFEQLRHAKRVLTRLAALTG